MTTKTTLLCLLLLLTLPFCSEEKSGAKEDFVIAKGQMPNVAKDRNNDIHVVYGAGDSILYTYSNDAASSFSKPTLLAVVPHAFTFATRGPQIAGIEKGLLVTACTSLGDIHTFYKESNGNWKEGKRINDVDTVAKEGLMGLSADGNNVFAAWLDVRENKRNKLYGARSADGGKTWFKNVLVYASPDSTICECCKPSVVLKDNKVYVMFRNWLQGNRDLYLAQSNDGGNNFEPAQKLGNGSWKLHGCPMDGGSLAVNENREVQTVWRREGTVYKSVPGEPEEEIGDGKNCTMEIVGNKNVYAWVENGEVVVTKQPRDKKIVGRGNQPVLKALGKERVLCVWEQDKQIHASILHL